VERTLLEAAVRAPRADVARALIHERLGVRESSAYTWSKYAEVLAASGEESGSAAAAKQAGELARAVAVAATASLPPDTGVA
jgi:hypothetical protein